ncbi:MAG: hypothetical protein AAGD06_01175 [Acidobacteriota bacterium]
MKRFAALYVAPVLALLALAMAPLISGERTLYYRDVLTSHYPLKAAQAFFLRAGELPLIDPFRSGGQPLLGNPNALPLYPDNLLYLVGSPLWALNAHFWLHVLLAPLAGFWLGRAWGLGRPAAWAVGVAYGTCGYFLSQLNLYNLVAGAALAPALVAAFLDAAKDVDSPGVRRWRWPAAIWALMILAGDPMTAVMALGLALLAVAVSTFHVEQVEGRPRIDALRRGLKQQIPVFRRLALALGVGTVLAAPMWVEFLRILPLSYRGYWRYSIEAALSQSWDPRTALEWLLPFAFGNLDYGFWGKAFFAGNPPLFYSLYPGWGCLALVAAAGLPRSRPAAWGWLCAAAGLFFALGFWNPLVQLLYLAPGASALRFPIKFWLLVAVPASLLVGLGFERLRAGPGRRAATIVLGGGGILMLGSWLSLVTFVGPLPDFLHSLAPETLVGPRFEAERLRWATQCFFSLGTLGLLGLCLALMRRRPAVAGALLLTVHTATQLFLLQPLYDSDDSAPYLETSPLLAHIPEDAVVVHGGFNRVFGGVRGDVVNVLPDLGFHWISRASFKELYHSAGVPLGRRYELSQSPEGLDSFHSVSIARALESMDDRQRLRILAAAGVDRLLLPRALDPEAAEEAELLATMPSVDYDLHVYRPIRAAEPYAFLTSVRRAENMSFALGDLTADDFDPRTMAVIPGDNEVAGDGEVPGDVAVPLAPAAATSPTGAGSVTLEHTSVERDGLRVVADGPGILTTPRAWLPLWRAEVDGEPVPTQVVNGWHLGVELPAGDHRVTLWIDRRPTRLAFGAAALALLSLLWPSRKLTAAPGGTP